MIETELCAFSLEACRAAARAGVTRVELCASPYEGVKGLLVLPTT